MKIVKETGVNLIFGTALLALLWGNLLYNTDIYFIDINFMQHPKTDQSVFEQNMLIVELMVVLDEYVPVKDYNT